MRSILRQKVTRCIVVLLAAVFFIPAIAEAFSPGEGKPDKGFGMEMHQPLCGLWRDQKMIQALGLTDAQVRAIRDEDFKLREKRLALKAELDGLRLQMERALSSESPDEAAVLELGQKITDLKGKLFMQDIEARLKLQKLLTAEQRKKLMADQLHRPPEHEMENQPRGSFGERNKPQR